MRRLSGTLVILVLGTLVLAAGCTGIPGMPKTGSSGSASPAIMEPTGMAGSSWTGTFMTTWSGGGHDVRMVLVQSGKTVIGTYEYNGGTITGTVQDNRLVGTWAEDNGASTGPVEFDIAPDGKTFSGWWAYTSDDFSDIKKGTPSWTGIRVS